MVLLALVLAVSSIVGCARTPSRGGLVTKLEQRNGLTATQARCIAEGLYEGMPDAQPAIRRLTSAELRAVAKPDNAGKVSAEVVQILRDVTGHCVPAAASTTAP